MDYDQKRELILKGSLTKVIFSLAFPLMLSNLIQTIYNLTDTYWVGQIGATELAAITLVWPLIFFFMSLGIGVNIAGTALISQYIGSQRQEEAADVAGQILSFSFWLSIAFALIGFLLAPSAVAFMGGQGILLEKAVIYMRIIFVGMPFMFSFFAFSSIKQAQGNTLTPMKLSGISVALNIILDPIFIFTLNLGIAGAAYATVFSRALLTIYAVYSLFTKDNHLGLRFKHLRLKKTVLLQIVKIGLPSSIGQSATAFGFMILNRFIIYYGNATLAAFGIGNRINSLILMPAMGIGSALATIIGQNLGADQIKRAKQFVSKSILLCSIILILGGVIMFFSAEIIISQFSQDPEVIQLGTAYLQLISLSLPLVGIFQIFIGTFQGSGHTVSAMLLMAGRLWGLRIPLILLFQNITTWGSTAIWYAMVLSNLIICLTAYAVYLTGGWQKKVIKKTASLEPIDEAIS